MKNIIFVIIISILAFTAQTQADDDPYIQENIPTPDPQPELPPPQENPLPPRKFQLNAETLYMYRYQAGAILAIFAYIIIYKQGKSANAKLVEKFYAKTRELIENNFEHIGFNKQNGADPFVGVSPNEFMFYASGRNNCNYLEMSFETRKRQDLIYYTLYEAIYPEKDTITIDIPVKSDHPLVFCLAHKKKLKHLLEKYLDIKQLTSTLEIKTFPHHYSVLGENVDIFNMIFDTSATKILKDHSNLIVSLHYTDQKVFSNSQGHLRAVFQMSKKNQQLYKSGLEFLFSLVDKIVGLRVPATYKTKAIKSRETLQEMLQKENLEKHQEELKKKKEEKKREDEAWLKSLPPNKQKREDEKRKKKEINKLYKSKTMKM